jgi:hypothetical protein
MGTGGLAGFEALVARAQHRARVASEASAQAWLPPLLPILGPSREQTRHDAALSAASDALHRLLQLAGAEWTLPELVRLLRAARALGARAAEALPDARAGPCLPAIMVAAGALAAGGELGGPAEGVLTCACVDSVGTGTAILLAVAAAGERFTGALREMDGGRPAAAVASACIAAVSAGFEEDQDAARATRANAALLGRTAGLLAPAAFVAARVHEHAVALENVVVADSDPDGSESGSGRAALLQCALGAFAGGRDGALEPGDALFVIDTLALLRIPVSRPPHPLLTRLATCVAADASVLAELGVLASSVTTPPEEPRPRALVILYALILSLGSWKHEVSDEIAIPSPVNSAWEDVSTLLRQAYCSTQVDESKSKSSSTMRMLALDACMSIVSSGVANEEGASKIGVATWDVLLSLYPSSGAQASDLARAIDSLVGGGMSRDAVVDCAERLEVVAHGWSRPGWRRVSVVLVLRAVLRCELRVLADVLDVAARLVRREGARDVARDAVLGADAVRKGQLLAWYFDAVIPQSLPTDIGRPVAKL